MKRYSKVLAVLILLVFGAAAGESAMARGGGRGGSGHGSGSGHGGGYSHGGSYGHGYGHGYGVGVYLGGPLYWPGYYPGYYPYPYTYSGPDYSYPGPAGAYVEQGVPQAAPAQSQDWYYCAGSNAYYPYVRECPGGWQRVPSVPPPPR